MISGQNIRHVGPHPELAYIAEDTAMTPGQHALAQAARGRPLTSDAIGETTGSDYSASVARARANVVFEGQERREGASRAHDKRS
jgi:hypothetical protein